MLKEVILDTGKEKLNLTVQSVRFFKNLVIVKFKEYNNINDIESIKCTIILPSSVLMSRMHSLIAGSKISFFVSDCYQDICRRTESITKPRVIYLTPQGKTFEQKMAVELAAEETLVFLCGHYEGIDERVSQLLNGIIKSENWQVFFA